MLYKFEQLDAKLTELGYPQVEVRNPYVPIQTDFETVFRQGRISFDEDGIFIEHEGRKYKGYMFIKEYHITRFRSFPRFHLVKCEKIDEFIRNGRFTTRYQFSNTATNSVVDIDSGTDYPDQVLRLCSYCSGIINEAIPNTQSFFEQLHEQGENIDNEEIEIDIYGYVRNWTQISRDFRKFMDYKCETCGIQIVSNIDRRYLHVHHKNGDKTNNQRSNLECNCILCHAYIDSTHEHNFSNKRLKYELKTFVKKYRAELLKLRNRNLTLFESE